MRRKEEVPKRAFREGAGRVPGVARRENPRRRYCAMAAVAPALKTENKTTPPPFPCQSCSGCGAGAAYPFPWGYPALV